MRLMIFPALVGLLMLGGCVAIVMIEQCFYATADPKIGCEGALPIVTALSALGAFLAAMAALFARLVLLPFLRPGPALPEAASAALSSALLVLALFGILNWGVNVGGAAGVFFGWPLFSFLICCGSLAVVKQVAAKAGRGECMNR